LRRVNKFLWLSEVGERELLNSRVNQSWPFMKSGTQNLSEITERRFYRSEVRCDEKGIQNLRIGRNGALRDYKLRGMNYGVWNVSSDGIRRLEGD
jgi:hypothetical protein